MKSFKISCLRLSWLRVRNFLLSSVRKAGREQTETKEVNSITAALQNLSIDGRSLDIRSLNQKNALPCGIQILFDKVQLNASLFSCPIGA